MDGSQDIINLNVSGKRFTVQRGNLLAVPTSKLAEWFRTDPNDNQLDKDKRGIYIFSNCILIIGLFRQTSLLTAKLGCEFFRQFKPKFSSMLSFGPQDQKIRDSHHFW